MFTDQEEGSTKFNKDRARMAVADLAMGIALIIICFAGAYLSSKMHSPRGWQSSPGLFPMFIFAGLFIMAITLLVKALRENLAFMLRSIKSMNLSEIVRSDKTRRFLFIIFWVIVYIEILLRFLPFELGTIAYLIGTLFVFWKSKIWKIIIISVVVTMFISGFFNIFFKTLLPGGSLLWQIVPKIF